MALSVQKDPPRNLYRIIHDLDKLEISERKRHELKECAKAVLDINVDQVSSKQVSSVHGNFNCDEIVVVLIKFAEITLNVIDLCQLASPQWSLVCNSVVGLIGYVFISDVASMVLQRFSRSNAIEEDFKARCRATSSKVSQCITYMQGLPKPDKLDDNTKKLHLQLMASDVPVHTGLDELLTLGVKITDMLKNSEGNNFHLLMEKVQLYCCLATFRELFLLYRFAIQSTFKVDAQAVKHVCDSQRKHDETVLKFLYMPTESTGIFFCKYRGSDWPVIRSFLDRRGLHPEVLSELSGAYVQIRSMYFNDRCLCVRKSHFGGNERLRCENNPDEQGTLFQLQGGMDNVFSILPCEGNIPCHISDKGLSLEISTGSNLSNAGRWCIQKIQSDSPNGTPSYVIKLAADDRRYMCVNQMCGQVSAKPLSNVGPRFLWQLVNAEEKYFSKLDHKTSNKLNIRDFLN